MMMMTRNNNTLIMLLSLVLSFTALPRSASGFTATTTTTVTTRQQQERRPMMTTTTSMMMVPRGLFSSASSSETSDAVLREFEKKEAKMRKRAEEAQAKLSAYSETLEKLQTKKAEYLSAGTQLAETPVGGSFSETTLRSAVKAFCWRIVAGTVTFITTLKFSGSITQAFQVVGADFFSKALTMFIGERLMNKSQVGRAKGGDNARRSLVKALIWRIFAICNTLTMAIFVSKDLSVASKIASTDAVFKTALMFFYERLWARIGWGKEYLIEFSI